MLKKIKMSAKNLTTVKGITLAGIFIAMHAVLGIFKFPFALDNRITFTFAVSAMAGMILGPVPALVICGCGDILGYLLNPGGGAYFFGFTLSAMLGGFIYGLCLYKRERKYIVPWTILAVFIITLFVNIILNTYWLSIVYEKAVGMFAGMRIIKNFVVFPLHVIVISVLGSALKSWGIKKYL